MQEFEAMRTKFAALGVRVRAVSAQHGDIRAMLRRRGCDLDFVDIVSDPSFSICKDYIAKGINLILDTEARPKLLASMVKTDGFATQADAAHNMVQPAVTIEDVTGRMLYKWTWHELHGDQKWGGETNSPTVFLRPTTNSLFEAIERGSFENIEIDTYPSKWPREAFPFAGELLSKAKL
jgi:hypothetical protein